MKSKGILMIIPVIGIVALMLLSGCGASKTYVDTAVAEEKARSEATVQDVENKIAENKAALEQLQSLTRQLDSKTDMAINEAKGFENYKVVWEGEIFFDFNSMELTVAAQEIIDQAGDKMIADRKSVMEIAGYTDPTGNAAYNTELGLKRAAAAKYYLVDNYGVNLYRIFTVSHGENKAVQSGDGEVSYAKQRKVKLKLWAK
ncbi:MAG: OmpA family protein [candidate division Zixibacteria bacterium]